MHQRQRNINLNTICKQTEIKLLAEEQKKQLQ